MTDINHDPGDEDRDEDDISRRLRESGEIASAEVEAARERLYASCASLTAAAERLSERVRRGSFRRLRAAR